VVQQQSLRKQTVYHALEDVSFSALPGGVTGYLGPNGSGKSTTMKMIGNHNHRDWFLAAD